MLMLNTGQVSLFNHNGVTETSIDRNALSQSLKALLQDISLEQFVALLTNEFEQVIQYHELALGAHSCQLLSLLFNPHRLLSRTRQSQCSIYDALCLPQFIDGLARAVCFKRGKCKELLYQVLQLGINTVQYVNEFPPHIARAIALDFHLSPDMRVLDPCAGWGGRLIGLSTVVHHYTAYDPATRTVEGLRQLTLFIQAMQPGFQADIIHECFEDAKVQKASFDFALTSPPYYNSEIYSDESTQSCHRYKNFLVWCELFFCPLIEKTMYALKPSGVFVLNIGSRAYPLREVLFREFAKHITIQQLPNFLGGSTGGLKNPHRVGEEFFALTH